MRFFTFDLGNNHGELRKLKLANELKSPTIPDSISKIAMNAKGSRELLKLLMPELRKETETPLYLLYPEMLADNDSIIRTLETLLAYKIETSSKMENILANFLGDIFWDDLDVLEKVTPVIIKLHKKYPAIGQYVQGLYLEK